MPAQGRWIVSVRSAAGMRDRPYNLQRGRVAHFLVDEQGTDLKTLCGMALDSTCEPRPGTRRCKRCEAKR